MGPLELRDIANMDQTPLISVSTSRELLMPKMEKRQYGLGRQAKATTKRQCTVQLTIFAYGEPHIKLLLIFKGTGQRIPDREKRQYDPRVVVKFQNNT